MNKKRKHQYAAMTSAALMIAVVIVVNIIIGVASNKINLNFDLTKDSVLEFDEQTHKVISELDMDVKIISLIPEDNTDSEMVQIDEILNKFDTLSDRITYERADVQKNPGLLTSYKVNGEPLQDGYNIIFETERMNTVVSVNDVVIMVKDKLKGDYVSGALRGEQHFVSAILKVTKGSDINAYVTKGHGEKFDNEDFKTQVLPTSGYMFKPLNIISEEIPENADVLIINSPKNDYMSEEIEKINSYLMQGGNVQVFIDPTTPDLPLLFSFLSEWGIDVGYGLLGDDSSTGYAKYRTNVIANIPENEITKNISYDKTQVIFPVSRPVEARNKNDIVAYTLAQTSDDGFIKSNIESLYDTFESGDTYQKSDIAVMVTRPNYDGKSPKLFVSGSAGFLEVNSNANFYSGLMATMTEQPYSVYIQPKNILQSRVSISQATTYIYTFITVIFIPVIILACGFIIWVKRRHL